MTKKFGKKDRFPTPPEHLSDASKTWWQSVINDFLLDQHHLLLLTAACECLDRAKEAREAVARDGAYVVNRWGETRKHPAIGVERDALVGFARLLRELRLDTQPAEESRPPKMGFGLVRS